MMSLFSSFEALCAERLRFSESVERRRSLPTTEDGLKIDSEEAGNKSSAPAPAPLADKSSGKEGKQGIRRNPRFAVELDGVHCFETILPF